MVSYSDTFIDEIRTRVDLIEVIGRQVTLKKKGVNWEGLCPFHNEKTPSFFVHPEKGFYKCFGCGAGGDAIHFVMKTKGLDFPEAIQELAALVGLPLPSTASPDKEYKAKQEERRQLLDLMESVRDYFSMQLMAPQHQQARIYLKDRGLSMETIHRFKLGFAPSGWSHLLDRFGGVDAAYKQLDKAGLIITKPDRLKGYDRFRERIIFPIHDIRGQCVGFGGRAIGGGEPKYLNSPETPIYHKGELLYGMDLAQTAIQSQGQVVVVEGYMDLIALSNHGIHNVVATLGTALTSAHLRILWRRTKHILFCFDGDNAGRQAAWRALELVMDGLLADQHAEFLFLPQGEDPDDVVRREGGLGFRSRMKQAVSLSTFLFQGLTRALNVDEPEGQAAVMHRATPLLNRVFDPLLRQLLTEDIAQRLHIKVQPVIQKSVQAWEPKSQKHPHKKRDPVPCVATHRTGLSSRSEGRDFEQILLASILRNPGLLQEHEERLGSIQLENAQLSHLLTELLDLSHRLKGPIDSWPLEHLSDASLVDIVTQILHSEEWPVELAAIELEGSLDSCQLRQIENEIKRLLFNLKHNIGDSDENLIHLTKHKRDECWIKNRKRNTLIGISQ
ncbi:MAG: DNA primase [Magnetococcus sp. DMHC-6]